MSDNKFCKFDWLISLLLGMLCMTCVLAFVGLLSGGEYALVRGDQMNNYIPAIRNFWRDIVSGEDTFYTWTYGYGVNTALFNAYYSMSPLNILYLIFFNADMNTVTAVNIIIKTGLAAMCFQIYLKRSHEVRGIISIIFAIFYSMCAFQVAFNIHNIIWLDALIVLPIVFMSIDMLLNEGKWILLTVSYAFIFISHFYMGYMIGLASFIYFVTAVVCSRKSLNIKGIIVRYAGAVALAIGVSAFIWLPALLFLMDNSAATLSEFPKLYSYNLLDIYNQLFWGEVSNFDAYFPYIYVGIPSLLLAPLFWIGKDEGKKDRIVFGILLIVMLASCLITPMYALWHGFDAPDSYGYRFSYIISFVLCTVAAKAADRLERNRFRYMFIFVALNVICYVTEMFWQKSRISADVLSNSTRFLSINCALMILWAGGFVLYKKDDGHGLPNRCIGALLIVLAVCESISNGYVTLRLDDRIGSTYTKAEYDAWYGFEQWITDSLSIDKGLYRVSISSETNPTAGAYLGYNSTMYFSSAENVDLRNALKNLGVWSSPRNVMNYGMNPGLEMLLGVRYKTEIVGQEVNGEVVPVNGIVVNDKALSIGYMVEGTADEYRLTEDAFDNMNKLLSLMTGEDINLYTKADEGQMNCTENGISISRIDEGYELKTERETDDSSLVYEIEDEGDWYAYVVNDESYYAPNVFFLKDDPQSWVNTNGAMTVSYMHKLTKENGRNILTVVPGEDCDTQRIKEILFAKYNEDELTTAYNKLSGEQLLIDDYGDGYLHGTIELNSDRTLLFLSIPYEKGWKAYLDGAECEIEPILDEAFMDLSIQQKGFHEIELVFEAPGKSIGRMISALSLVGFIIGFFFSKRLDKNLKKT